MLVGTHAFIAYQNIFGVTWQDAAMTLDLDFAHAGSRSLGSNISLALDEGVKMDAHTAIDSLEMGFLPLASGTTFINPSDPGLDLDFLTVRGRTMDEPRFSERLNLKMRPLKFMEFSLAEPMRATLLSRSGPLVVTLPRPERYAVHKLIVYGERRQEQRTKANKDLDQAAILLDYLLDHDEDEIKASWDDAMSRGPGWRARLVEGWLAMTRKYPGLDMNRRMQGAEGIESIAKMPQPATRPRML